MFLVGFEFDWFIWIVLDFNIINYSVICFEVGCKLLEEKEN